MSAPVRRPFVGPVYDDDADRAATDRRDTTPAPRPPELRGPPPDDDPELAERQARETLPAPDEPQPPTRGKRSGAFEVDATDPRRRDPRRDDE